MIGVANGTYLSLFIIVLAVLRVFVVGAIALPLLLAGCLGDAVSLDVLDWENRNRQQMGNSTSICEYGGNWVTLKVHNKGDVNIDLDTDHWQAVWYDVRDVRMRLTLGADNAPPGTSVEKEVWFCNPENGSGRPDELLLYDRAVYGSDKEQGAVVVASVAIG